jgi:hypothetical protein
MKVKTIYVSNSLANVREDGSKLHPYSTLHPAREWLLRERGHRVVKIRGGDVFDHGIGSLDGSATGPRNPITIEPWGDGSPVFHLGRRDPFFLDARQPNKVVDRGRMIHVLVRNLVVISYSPWHRKARWWIRDQWRGFRWAIRRRLPW